MADQVTQAERKEGYILYSIAGAVLYLIPIVYYLQSGQFSNLYFLYLGNFAFGLPIAIYTFNVVRKNKDELPSLIVRQGEKVIIIGTLCAAVFSLIIVLLFFRDLFSWQTRAALVYSFPPTFNIHSPAGILLLIFLDLIICNIAAGSFVNVLIVFAYRRMRR